MASGVWSAPVSRQRRTPCRDADAAPGRAARRRGRRSRDAATNRPAASARRRADRGRTDRARRSSTRRATGCRRCSPRHPRASARRRPRFGVCCARWVMVSSRSEERDFPAACGRSAVGSASPCQGEGRGFESRRPLEDHCPHGWTEVRLGGVAERRGNGLQSRVHGFKSRLHLGNHRGVRPHGRLAQGLARFLDTEEVTGSIPVSPTIDRRPPLRRGSSCVLGPSGPTRLTGRRRWERGSTYGNVGEGLSPPTARRARGRRHPPAHHPGRHGRRRLVLAARAHGRAAPASWAWCPAPGSTSCSPAACRTATPTATCAAPSPRSPCPRWPTRCSSTTSSRAAAPAGEPYLATPRPSLTPTLRAQRLTVVANFVEVFLAKEGHDGVVGVNYLEKIQMTTPYCAYGAMLAGVDVVLMGAGIPAHIPQLLNELAEHRTSSIPVDVVDALPDETWAATIDPVEVLGAELPPLRRPVFLAIVANHVLAQYLARDEVTRPDGFVIEAPERRRSQRTAARQARARRDRPAGLRPARRRRHRQVRRRSDCRSGSPGPSAPPTSCARPSRSAPAASRWARCSR